MLGDDALRLGRLGQLDWGSQRQERLVRSQPDPSSLVAWKLPYKFMSLQVNDIEVFVYMSQKTRICRAPLERRSRELPISD